MIIRPADIDDARAIGTIIVRSWQHAYADILPAEGLANLSIEDRQQQWAGWLQAETRPMQTLVAEIDGQVVGFTSWGPSEDEDEANDPTIQMLYSIYLMPDSKSKGIGSALLEAAEVEMIASGAHIGSLHVLEQNAPTRKFYERHGWKLVDSSARNEHFFGMDMITVRYRKQFI